jgi:hypothetical protein
MGRLLVAATSHCGFLRHLRDGQASSRLLPASIAEARLDGWSETMGGRRRLDPFFLSILLNLSIQWLFLWIH